MEGAEEAGLVIKRMRPFNRSINLESTSQGERGKGMMHRNRNREGELE